MSLVLDLAGVAVTVDPGTGTSFRVRSFAQPRQVTHPMCVHMDTRGLLTATCGCAAYRWSKTTATCKHVETLDQILANHPDIDHTPDGLVHIPTRHAARLRHAS
jgi:hypothetical protein